MIYTIFGCLGTVSDLAFTHEPIRYGNAAHAVTAATIEKAAGSCFVMAILFQKYDI